MPTTDLIKIITDLGMGAVVVWVVFNTFRNTIPNMMKDFRTELRDERRTTESIVRALDQNTRLLLYLIARITGKVFNSTDPVEDFSRPSPNCPPTCPFAAQIKPILESVVHDGKDGRDGRDGRDGVGTKDSK